jgi:hypothetical protein
MGHGIRTDYASARTIDRRTQSPTATGTGTGTGTESAVE